MRVRVVFVQRVLLILHRLDRAADQLGEVLLFVLDLVLLDHDVSPGAHLVIRLALVTNEAVLDEQVLVLFSETFQEAGEANVRLVRGLFAFHLDFFMKPRTHD